MPNIEKEAQKAILKDLKNDRYPEMTKEAVNKLWNDERYTKEGLWYIAFALMKKLWES